MVRTLCNDFSYSVVALPGRGFTVYRRDHLGLCSSPLMSTNGGMYPLDWDSSKSAWSWIDRGMAQTHPWWESDEASAPEKT